MSGSGICVSPKKGGIWSWETQCPVSDLKILIVYNSVITVDAWESAITCLQSGTFESSCKAKIPDLLIWQNPVVRPWLI